jgi:hypothetical protein
VIPRSLLVPQKRSTFVTEGAEIAAL